MSDDGAALMAVMDCPSTVEHTTFTVLKGTYWLNGAPILGNHWIE